jgi:hypothetical protein
MHNTQMRITFCVLGPARPRLTDRCVSCVSGAYPVLEVTHTKCIHQLSYIIPVVVDAMKKSQRLTFFSVLGFELRPTP